MKQELIISTWYKRMKREKNPNENWQLKPPSKYNLFVCVGVSISVNYVVFSHFLWLSHALSLPLSFSLSLALPRSLWPWFLPMLTIKITIWHSTTKSRWSFLCLCVGQTLLIWYYHNSSWIIQSRELSVSHTLFMLSTHLPEIFRCVCVCPNIW